MTVTVDALGAAVQQSEHHWRLPSTDPRDEGKYLFRLHTLDIYFWTAEDARHFIANAQAFLPPQHFQVDIPPTPVGHVNAMSPVVQNLENVAIAGNQSRSASTTAQVGSVAPTPGSQQQTQHQDPTSFTPLAYNPAAPPAPEEIKHREKTPPPPEDGAETGPGGVAYHGQHPGYQQQAYAQPQPSQHLPPPPPGAPPTSSTASPSHRASNASSYNPTSTVSPTPSSSAQQKYVPHGVAPQTYQQAQNPNQPLDSPTVEILGGGYIGGNRQPVGHLQPQYMDYLSSRPAGASPPPAQQQAGLQHNASHHSHHHSQQATQSPQQGSPGYPSFQPPPTSPHGTGDWGLHQQVYVPGEGESAGFGLKPGRSKPVRNSVASQGSVASGGSDGRGGRLEQGAARLEKGVGRFLKKVEKKIG